MVMEAQKARDLAVTQARSTSGATDRTNNLLLLTFTACRGASGRAYSYSYA
jgi:hypothetical protein